MAKKNYYVVKVGRKTGIFKTWAECSENVSGYPGAIYQGFVKEEEAKLFLYGDNYKNEEDKSTANKVKSSNTSKDENILKDKDLLNNNKSEDILKNRKTSKNIKSEVKELKAGYDVKPIRSQAKVKGLKSYVNPETIKNDYEFIAFVDGSYDNTTKTYGSGVVVLDIENNSYDTYFKAGHDKWDQWNIVGELEAAKLAITKAEELGVKNIAIYHDLKNISLWATGEWQAKNEYTQEYVRFMEKMSEELNILFVKVKAHSNESIYNDFADEAAKKAILDYIE